MRKFFNYLKEVATLAGPGIAGTNAATLYNNLQSGNIAQYPVNVFNQPITRKYPKKITT